MAIRTEDRQPAPEAHQPQIGKKDGDEPVQTAGLGRAAIGIGATAVAGWGLYRLFGNRNKSVAEGADPDPLSAADKAEQEAKAASDRAKEARKRALDAAPELARQLKALNEQRVKDGLDPVVVGTPDGAAGAPPATTPVAGAVTTTTLPPVPTLNQDIAARNRVAQQLAVAEGEKLDKRRDELIQSGALVRGRPSFGFSETLVPKIGHDGRENVEGRRFLDEYQEYQNAMKVTASFGNTGDHISLRATKHGAAYTEGFVGPAIGSIKLYLALTGKSSEVKPGARTKPTEDFGKPLTADIKRYQASIGQDQSGIVTWKEVYGLAEEARRAYQRTM